MEDRAEKYVEVCWAKASCCAERDGGEVDVLSDGELASTCIAAPADFKSDATDYHLVSDLS